MINNKIILGLLALVVLSCNSTNKESSKSNYNDLHIVGAMKNVMWKGELGSSISLDSISDKQGLYGIGPESYLTGELLINNGKSYVSRVTSDSTMFVEQKFDVSAPFFVYANVNKWEEIELPQSIRTIKDVEKYINEKTIKNKRPFTFKLIGNISKAVIHIQNLPEGTKVSSPDEAHQGQTNYVLKNEDVEVIGFFSTEHKGVFTHHDSYIHLHLITKDEQKMGHLDELEINTMKLYLPKE